MQVLVVDAANVVGSRPDGWWRDRSGAARRLHESLVRADLLYDRVVVVLEGQARAGVEAVLVGKVFTVHATASGDDEIVAQCHAHAAVGVVTLVSADRGLVARVADVVTEVLGPQALLATVASAAEGPTRLENLRRAAAPGSPHPASRPGFRSLAPACERSLPGGIGQGPR